MRSEMAYCLREGVQVRNEIFGLLFYDYRGPRLYFVPSKDLIEGRFFEGRQTVGELIESIHSEHNWPRRWIDGRVKQVLGMLEEKGLVYGQPVC
jgi:putative mycofactocin binding protein MftB